MDFDQAAKRTEKQIISGLEQVQDVTVKAVSRASSTIGRILPSLPRGPLATRLPAPEQLVNAGFGLAEKLVKTNKAYTLELLKALEPVREKVGTDRAKKTKTTTKAAAAAS